MRDRDFNQLTGAHALDRNFQALNYVLGTNLELKRLVSLPSTINSCSVFKATFIVNLLKT
jgi:hypothetical protein